MPMAYYLLCCISKVKLILLLQLSSQRLMNSCKIGVHAKLDRVKSCPNSVRPVMDDSDEELYLITQK